jgi:hypothetical protein
MEEATRALTRRQAVMGLTALVGTGLGLSALRLADAREAEPGDDHGSGGHGADDPPGDDHGSGGQGADDPPGDDNGGNGADDRGRGRHRRRRRGRGRHN